MKEKMVYGLVFLFLIALAGVPALHAENNIKEVLENTDEGYDEVSGQTGENFQETSAQAEGNVKEDPTGGNLRGTSNQTENSFKEVFSQDDTGGSDPSAFEGDTDSMPGERAPENLPMADAPVDAGMGID
jgi:hypothetical protein